MEHCKSTQADYRRRQCRKGHHGLQSSSRTLPFPRARRKWTNIQRLGRKGEPVELPGRLLTCIFSPAVVDTFHTSASLQLCRTSILACFASSIE